MRLGNWSFRPGLWPSLAAALLLPALIGLGDWQLERAAEKRAWRDAYEHSGRQAEIPLARALTEDGDRRYRAVAVSGRYDPDHQLLLDNRTHRGRAGYRVLTPLHLPDQGKILLVDRGWLPLGESRARLPALPLDAEPRTLHGLLVPPPAPGLILGPAQAPGAHGWPRVVERVEPRELTAQLGAPLIPQILLLRPDQPDGYLREWRPPFMGPERHLGYALQWFALAGLLLALYLGLNLRRVPAAS